MTHETPPQPEPRLRLTGEQIASIQPPVDDRWNCDWDEFREFEDVTDAARSAPLDVDAKAAALIEHANRAEAAAIALRDQRLVERWRGVAKGVAELAARLRATPPAGAASDEEGGA